MILDQLKDMFTVKYSPVGSSSHKLEVDTFAMFMDYLYECEKGNNTTILCKIFHMNYVIPLTSATDSVQVIDITEDEDVMVACTDTEEGRLQSQTS